MDYIFWTQFKLKWLMNFSWNNFPFTTSLQLLCCAIVCLRLYIRCLYLVIHDAYFATQIIKMISNYYITTCHVFSLIICRILLFVSFSLQEKDQDPVCLYPGFEHEPVLCMARQGPRVYVSCGAQLLVLNTTQGISIEKVIQTEPSR